MANVKVMYKLFDTVDTIISSLSKNDEDRKELLSTFFLRVLSVMDGVEGPDADWNGIALVATEDLPDNIQEINDEFLHDAWANRTRGRN